MSGENDYRLLLEFDLEDRYGEKYSEYKSLNYILKLLEKYIFNIP